LLVHFVFVVVAVVAVVVVAAVYVILKANLITEYNTRLNQINPH
jgi:hypothetical protein